MDRYVRRVFQRKERKTGRKKTGRKKEGGREGEGRREEEKEQKGGREFKEISPFLSS